jgi:prefoldin alpha subunit
MTDKKEENKLRREKLLELESLDGQIKQIEEQMIQIEEQMLEVGFLIENLSEIKNIKAGEEILVPLANGIFIKARIADLNSLKVNVGSGVVVDKTLDETIEMLKEQIKNIEKYKDEIFSHLQQMISQASHLQAYIVGED